MSYLDVEYVQTDIFGLIHKKQFIDNENNTFDNIEDWDWPTTLPEHFSKYDDSLLRKVLRGAKNNTSVILEIGVQRPEEGNVRSSTRCLIEEKDPETLYLGIDLEDRREICKWGANVHVVQQSSLDHLDVLQYIKTLGYNKIDFIFIDGFHSIEQVYSDWEYSEWLSDTGIVGFHDTNYHPGPIFCFDSIDETMFNKRSFLKGKNDWGMSFAWRI